MNVGFFTIFKTDPVHYQLAAILVASVKRVMPDVPVVHLSNETSPPVLGVDAVRRKPNGPLLELRMAHYADCDGDWLLLDTDTVVQKDARHVFDCGGAFDVAMSDREWNLVKDHYKYSAEMPYNTGVVFQRRGAFYQRVLEIWRGYDAEKRGHWWSEQWAVAETVREGRFATSILPGMVYNRPPATVTEDVSDAVVLHYKGPERKLWMLTKYQPKRGYENALIKSK